MAGSNLPKNPDGTIKGGPGRIKGGSPSQMLEQVKAWGLDPLRLATEWALDTKLKIPERQNALLMVLKRTIPEVKSTEIRFEDSEGGGTLNIIFNGNKEPLKDLE